MPPGKNILWNHIMQAENYCPLYALCIIIFSCFHLLIQQLLCISFVPAHSYFYCDYVYQSWHSGCQCIAFPYFRTSRDTRYQYSLCWGCKWKAYTRLPLSADSSLAADWTLLGSCDYTAGKENPFHACQYRLHRSTDVSLQRKELFCHLSREGFGLCFTDADFWRRW